MAWAVRFSSVNASACHPFKAGRFLFAHNGLVGNFTQIRRELLTSLNEQLGEGMKGRM
jgi:glutamine amidotransferase